MISFIPFIKLYTCIKHIWTASIFICFFGLQLSEIPGIPFWSGMRKLEMLFLHDNPLGKYETLQSLACCPNLLALTLHDTPLSLKKNYRHHVANSIWTLKALDHYVISDEEIIEDAMFGGEFGTLNPAFRINLCPPTPEVSERSNTTSF